MTITQCVFKNNSALYTESNEQLSTTGAGGGIYYSCDSSVLNCKLNISGATQFTDNFAFVKGGAIYWDELEPNLSSDLIFKNNSALEYGNNIACFAA